MCCCILWKRPAEDEGLSVLRSLLLLMMMIALQGHCLETGDRDDDDDVVNAARCRVRCISVMQRALELQLPSVFESNSLLVCLREEECEACLRPCNQPSASLSDCEETCQLPRHDHSCRESCRFLEEARSLHPDRCPPDNEIAAATVFQCTTTGGCHGDADCGRRQKCCVDAGCGGSRTCRPPTSHLFDDTPEIPGRPMIRERPKPGSVELRWKAVSANLTIGPVLYIVESRWNIGRQEREGDMSHWQQTAQTTGTSTVIGDITPGHWYQFRVSAVNINGRRGSSLPTKAFTPSKEPRRPGPPSNVTEGDTLIMGGKVAVNIHWLHPKKLDVPISRYKLFWGKKTRGGTAQTSNEFRQVVPGDQLMFQIPDLDPDNTYVVQLQAICQYDEVRLKSDKVSLFITTYPLPRSDLQVLRSRTVHPPNVPRSVPTPPAPLQLKAHRPFYSNGVLKANVSWSPPLSHSGGTRGEGAPLIDRVLVFWSPEACIADHLRTVDGLAKVMSGSTQDHFFLVYDLRFDCRYLIRVQSVTNQGVLGVTTQLTLVTPTCHKTSVVGNDRPECTHSTVRLPEEPANFEYSFSISSSNITACFNWDGPTPPDSAPEVTGYRVVWGQVSLPQTTNPDPSSTLTKVLPVDARSFALTGLREGTTYSVKLQALTAMGAGRRAVLHLTTPLLHVSPRNSEFHENGEEEEGNDDADDNNNNRYDDAVDYDAISVVDGSIRAFDSGRQTSVRQMAPRNPSSAVTATSERLQLLVRPLAIALASAVHLGYSCCCC